MCNFSGVLWQQRQKRSRFSPLPTTSATQLGMQASDVAWHQSGVTLEKKDSAEEKARSRAES